MQIYVLSFGKVDPSYASIAESTGGLVIRASDADTMNSLYARIKNSEEYRYVNDLPFVQERGFCRGGWSDVSIKISLNGVSGVEWGGYYVPLPKGIPYKPVTCETARSGK